MKTANRSQFAPPLTLALAISLMLANAQADTEDVIKKSFKVEPGGQVVLDVDRGSIEVKAGDVAAVDIQVTRTFSGSESKAKEIFKDHAVTFTQEGNAVRVQAKSPPTLKQGWFGSWFRSWRYDVKYEITVPREFNADLKTSGGSIAVTGIQGKLMSRTSGGSLRFAAVQGPINGKTSGGSIKAENCKGDLDLETSGGSVSLSGIEGKVNAHSSGGAIRAEKLAGPAVLKTSGGSITVTDSTGPITAKTSGGSIQVSLSEAPGGDCTFETSGGGIRVQMPNSAALNLDARTSGGRVSSELDVVSSGQDVRNKTHLQGKINGGGPKLLAHTSGGSVHIATK